jgi:hypothetical protein
MSTYLDRYLAGEYEAVWDELTALGDKVRQEPLYSDAIAVARETMRLARHNVELIVSRLRESGYEFQGDGIILPTTNVAEQIAELEAIAGMLPLSLRTWYEIVGEVSLMGTHPDWDVTGYSGFWRSADVCTDPLVVTPIYYALSEAQDWKDWANEKGNEQEVELNETQLTQLRTRLVSHPEIDEAEYVASYKKVIAMFQRAAAESRQRLSSEPFEIPISPDLLHKSNISGTGGNTIVLPNAAADAVIEAPEGPHGLMFVSYIRNSFRWGGFPGFADEPEENRPTEYLAYLTKDLLPI